ncbi:hypothetical protein D9M68_934000 [compost metagenome]
MGVQQLVVIAGQGRQVAGADRLGGVEVGVGHGRAAQAQRAIAVGHLHAAIAVAWRGGVGDVVEECMARTNGGGGADGRGGIAFRQAGGGDDLDEPIRPAFEAAVLVGGQ